MNGIFYTGVVENRRDPTRLGRCQVRVVGLHTENKSELPTELLPWAFPMQPVTSAAMNGIGHSPLGPVEGTWVVIFFRDQECQQPIMMGTIGGIPQNTGIESNYLNDGDDYLIKTDGGITETSTPQPQLQPGSNSTTPETSTETVAEQFIGPLTEDEVTKYKDNVARIETTSEPGALPDFSLTGTVGQQNYGVVNPEGKVGKYQLSGTQLNTLGYVTNVLNSNGESVPPSNQKLADDTIWTGKNGLTSVGVYLSNAEAQEQVMDEWTKYNYSQLIRKGVIDANTDKKVILGYLGGAHPSGVDRALALKNGRDSQDGYGKTTTDLYKNAYSALEGDQPKTLPQNVPAGADSETVPLGEKRPDGTISDGTPSGGGVTFGFSDPNKKYPLKDYLNEPDTNRLARNDMIEKTVVGIKDSTRTQKVPVSITNATWDQPESPYNASYPFNHTYQSESGHVQEFDDTPENERIHLYHTKGSFFEIDVNGTQVNKIVGDGYQIIDRNGYIYIKGAHNLTVDGVTNVFFRSDANIEVVGNANIHARNNVDMRVSGKMDLSVLEDLNIECQNFHLSTREDACIVTANSLFLTSINDMHVGSKTSILLTAAGNLSGYAGANVLLESNLSTNLKSNSNINLSSSGTANVSSTGPLVWSSSSSITFRASGHISGRAAGRIDWVSTNSNVNIQGDNVYLNSGTAGNAPALAATAVSAQQATQCDFLSLQTPLGRITPVNSFFPHLTTPPRGISGGSQFESPDEGDPSKFNEVRQSQGVDTNKQSQPVDTAPAPVSKPPDGKVVTCEGFANVTEFPVTAKLSANFYLGDFIPGGGSGYICVASSPHKLQDQDGLTKAQIVCNLKALAENVLENIIKIIPKSEILVTSGYRQKGLVGAESATSQHPKGMACDIVLKKTPRDRKKHYDLIQQIAASVPHDQLLLEYEGAATVWIHISYNPAGKQRGQQFTMNNHHKTGNGFQLLV
jgi:hypothetical protein